MDSTFICSCGVFPLFLYIHTSIHPHKHTVRLHFHNSFIPKISFDERKLILSHRISFPIAFPISLRVFSPKLSTYRTLFRCAISCGILDLYSGWRFISTCVCVYVFVWMCLAFQSITGIKKIYYYLSCVELSDKLSLVDMNDIKYIEKCQLW